MMSKEVSSRMANRRVTADVVVVGGGPGGSVAAKNCAQHGMHTILLEKHRLPRLKVCCGMLISNLVHTLVTREFGIIPEEVLTDPPNIAGYQWHTSGHGDEQQDMPKITNTWRKELDYWMNRKAQEAGAEIWEEALVTDITPENEGNTLKIKRSREEQEVRARFVIGADGAASVIRKRIFPDLNVRLIGIRTECHSGALDADRRYFHIFGSARTAPGEDWFDVLHKKDCFLINVNGAVRSPKEAMSRAKQTLAERWGFNINGDPLWSGGTAVPTLRQELYSGKFLPAKGNVVLVGDAAGIATPSERGEGEGMNMALKTGLLASRAVIKAADTSREAAALYLPEISRVIETCKTIAADIIYYTVNWTQREKLLDDLG